MTLKKHACCSAITIAMLVSGCAAPNGGTDQKTAGAVVGAGLGCAGGAILAKLTGNGMAAGCVVGAAVGGLVGFEKARQDEIAAAEQARNEAMQAMAALPPTKRASGGEIKTVEVTATDKKTKETRKYKAFESVSLDMPLSTKGTPEHDAAMAKLKTLAERVADDRGSAEIQVAMTPADVKARKVSLIGGTANTAKGHPITVSKFSDSSVPAGVERITVKAGRLHQTEV